MLFRHRYRLRRPTAQPEFVGFFSKAKRFLPPLCLLFIIAPAAHAATDCAAQTEIPPSECLALLDLYHSTSGLADGWNTTNAPCSWAGVTCSAGRVTQLVSIGWSYDNSRPALTGPLPNLNLPALQVLDLSYNQLSGSIPDLNLPALQELNLANNQFSGSIPDFSHLPSLRTLSLSGNPLSGSIPDFRHLSALQELGLSSNSLSGGIPNFSHLPALQGLYLHYTQLSGGIPDFSHLPALQVLDLRYNQLSGGIPNFSHLLALQVLDLSNNQLSGGTPDFSHLSVLHEINLSDNQLSGDIPDFSYPPALRYLYLHNNQFSGSIPDFSHLPVLTWLHLHNNQLSGGIPDFSNLPELTQLYLSNNQLSGSIPDFSHLPALTQLYLSGNQLGGVIPMFNNSLNLISWGAADFSYNLFTGDIADRATFLQSNWAATQTVPPGNVSAAALSATSVRVSWTPIAYTGDGGYYQVRYAANPGGPYTLFGTTTADKTASHLDVTGLNSGATYYFVVETHIPAHGSNPSALTSLPSEEVLAVTPNSGAINLNTGVPTDSAACFDSQVNTAFNRSGNGLLVLQNEAVNLGVQLTADPNHVGQAGKLLLLVSYQHGGNTLWLTRAGPTWQFWQPGAALPAAENYTSLPDSLEIPIYSGLLHGLPGVFTVYAGYLLDDGTLLHNLPQPLRVTVANALILGTQTPAYAYFNPVGNRVEIHTPPLAAKVSTQVLPAAI